MLRQAATHSTPLWLMPRRSHLLPGYAFTKQCSRSDVIVNFLASLVGVGASAPAQVSPIPSGATLYSGASPASTSTASGALPRLPLHRLHRQAVLHQLPRHCSCYDPFATPAGGGLASISNPIVALFAAALDMIIA